MDKYYKIVLNIHLQHEFFMDGKCATATLKPLPETSLFLKNHRMMLKQKKDSYVLLQEASLETKEATIVFNNAEIWFGVNFNDQNFQLRSGLNYDLRKQKIVVRMDSNPETSITEANVLTVRNSPEYFSNELNHVLLDNDNNLILTSEVESTLRFTGLDTGIYKVEHHSFLKCNSCNEFDSVLCIKLDSNQENVVQKMTMPAGQYRWRYQILKKYSKAKNLSLIDENEKMVFEEVTSTESDRVVFLSKDPVKLSQHTNSSLVLYDQESIVKKFLPLPELLNVRFLSAVDKTLVMETFVTI